MPYDLMNVQYQSGQYSDVMPEDIKQIYGSFVEIAEPLNTKIDQYYFTYWSTQKDGSGIRYYPGQKIRLTQHHTLYAQWSTDVKKMQIDFNRTANDTVKTYWMNQAQGFNLDMIRPQYPGYQLVSFNTQKDGSGLVYQLDDIIHSKDNLVLYAQWETMDYLSIQFDTLGQGELLGKSHYQLAANTVLGMNPQVRAYGNKRFVGWMLNGLQVDLNTFEIKENHTFEALYEDKNLNYYFDEVHREKGSQRVEVSFDFGVYAKPTIVRQNYTEGMPVQVPLSVRLPRDVKLIGFELDGKAIQLDTLKASEGLYLTAVYGEKDSEVLDKTLLNYKPIPELNESRSRLSRAGVIKVLLLLIAALLIIVDGVRKIRLRRRTHESSC